MFSVLNYKPTHLHTHTHTQISQSLQGSYIVWTYREIPKFCKKVLLPSPGQKNVSKKHTVSIFRTEDGGSMFVPNAGCLRTGSYGVTATQETNIEIFTPLKSYSEMLYIYIHVRHCITSLNKHGGSAKYIFHYLLVRNE
jgi:hypothetical protein